MSHGITDTDNLFSTRKPTWHGMGHIFENYPTREEAQAIAHPWEPVTEPVFTSTITATDDGVESGFAEIPGHQAITRSDNGNVIGVVSDTYHPVSNNELWDIAEALESSSDDVMFETGGSLKGGAKVWLMLKLREPLEVPGDPNGATIPYYTLQNSHDGSGSLRGQATMMRIVCANTAHAADIDSKARGTEFTFRHTRNVGGRIEQAKEALAGWRQGLTDLQERYQHLLSLNLTRHQISDFEERFFPAPPAGLETDRVMNNVLSARDDWRGVLESSTNEAIRGTAYGLVQATIEYTEHVRRAHNQETRFRRSYIDRNDVVKKAVSLATKV